MTYGEVMNELALFAGAGGGILGGHLLGWRTVCAVEREPYAASVLMQRQNDGILPPFPIWDDVCTFDGRPWRGLVDVVSGGFPCQDISAAGNGAGIDGDRSGLWREMARIIGEVRPRFVFVENSPLLISRGLAVVISDLAEMGYDAQWCCISASDVGAPHKRDRIWLVASDTEREPMRNETIKKMESEESEWKKSWVYGGNGNVADADMRRTEWREQQQGGSEGARDVADPAQLQRDGRDDNGQGREIPESGNGYSQPAPGNGRWPIEPDVGRVADGVAARVDRLKAIGNGQVPRVAATAFAMMAGEL